MNIIVKVTPNSSKNEILKETDFLGKDIFKVKTKAKPQNNKANNFIIVLLAKYFGVSKNNVKIIRGLKSKIKIVKILEDPFK